MKKIYYLTYAEDKDWAEKEGINQDLLSISLTSLHRHSDASIVLLLPEVEKKLSEKTLTTLRKLNVCRVGIGEEEWRGRRMFCRLKQFGELLEAQSEGTLLISGEVDEIFLSDPFEFFEQGFDIGLAARDARAKVPVNAGLVFFRKSNKVVDFYSWAQNQILNPNWETYLRLKYRKNTLDVYCDRDWWWATWEGRHILKTRFGLDIKLLDCGYLMNEAIKNGQCSFHLKGQSKNRIYEKDFSERIRSWVS